MLDQCGVNDEARCRVLHQDGSFDFPAPTRDSARMWGVFHCRCVGSDGVVKWEDDAYNLIVNSGLNDVLNAYIRDTTQSANWYMGLVDNASFTAFAAGDVFGGTPSHAGWIENAAYSNGTRPAWAPGAASGQSITNASTVNFSINANTQTIHGLFIINNATISGTAGTLFSEAAFNGGNQPVNNGDTLQCTYTLSLASN